ncbi:MAG TPA: efflux RND transporter periplasmic adaptor subunit [Candidatus Lustribacter sp.]
MKHKRRWWVALAALAIVVAGVSFVLAVRRPAATTASEPAAPNVPLAVARNGDFIERVEAQGRIGPPAGSSAKVAFAQSGIVRTIDVRVGQSVSAGQPLAELDRAGLDAARRAAQAEVQATGANVGGGIASVRSAVARVAVASDKLDTLERGGPAALNSRIAAQSAARQAAIKVDADRATVARDEQLLAAGVIAGKDADAARSQLASDEADQRAADAKVAAAGTDFQTALKQARADLAAARSDVQAARGQAASAQARLDVARIAYANGILAAPAGGVVLAILKHPGEAVDPTIPVIEVGPALGHSVTLPVPADVARRIAVGNPVTLHVASARENVTHGEVTAVVPAVDPATQVGTVVADGAPADAVPGDAVTATIVVGHVRGVLVPSSAIVQDPQTGKTVVFVRDAHPKAGQSGFSLRAVTVRASDAANASIAVGLRAGERVAAQGGYTLLAPAGG